MVLVGTPASNRWIARIGKQLPVQITEGSIAADGKRYDAANGGAIFIIPNPLNPAKYAAVFSGLSESAIAALPRAYSAMKDLRAADVGVFEITDGGEIRWHVCEKFDTSWGWHERWGQVIAATSTQYSRMKWLQVFGRAMRVELEADAAVCEDPFLNSDDVPDGEMTFRDLNNMVKNEWVVKVRVSGKTLRRVLTTAFTDYPNRQLKPIIVDGVSFSRGDNEGGAIPMSDIDDEKYYTVVLPEDVINGHRAGAAIEEYEIVGDGYLVLLVRDFLVRNKESGIDALSENMEPRVF
jgi:hypothetical protein